jgi:ArsR family transcriptional regulator
MDLVSIYRCLCDRTRLRILNLLCEGPLCVCHFQRLLGEPQVKMSKHLAYLRARRMVVVTREANWRIYRLPSGPCPELKANLACLQDCVREQPVFRRDRERLRLLRRKPADSGPVCCPAPGPARKRRKPAASS